MKNQKKCDKNCKYFNRQYKFCSNYYQHLNYDLNGEYYIRSRHCNQDNSAEKSSELDKVIEIFDCTKKL